MVGDRLDSSISDRLGERLVIADGLIRIIHREFADRVVEGPAGAHVAGDNGGIARSRMRLRQRPCARSRLHPQHVEVPPFDEGRHFHIAKLAYVHVETAFGTCPAEEQVAGRLDHALANDDALAVV